ncbi:MAG: 4Fe-4S dicluster domain-containing protein [Pseudomonadota bacterium]
MIKNPLFALVKPKLKYPVLGAGGKDAIAEIPLPSQVTLHVKALHSDNGSLLIKTGDSVRTGQRLTLAAEGKDYIISPVTGTVAAISRHPGYMGQVYGAISIDVAEKQIWDVEFEEAGKAPNLDNVSKFLGSLPGEPDFGSLLAFDPPLGTLVIGGIDRDLLITTNQSMVKNAIDELREGVEYLKNISGVRRILIIVPPHLRSLAEKTGAEVGIVDAHYPDTLPKMVLKNLLGIEVPAGKRCEDVGVGFINAEAVVALGGAFAKGKIPVEKTLSVIRKDGTGVNVKARIGTPIRSILKALDIETRHGDRVVLGGPMTGKAVFSEETPISYDTGAVMVQDQGDVTGISDCHCVNCGECVRACPADVPVNMLIRFLENGLFEEAASQYDLHSCIECGLCSYVCIARIPIFQYIMLGKYELAQIQMKNAEGSNA